MMGITSYGRKMVKSGSVVLEREVPRGCLAFATLTVPGMPPDAAGRLAEAWPELIRQLIQQLRRWLASAGCSEKVLSATEIQEKRLAAGKGAALHLHMVWQSRRRRNGQFAVSVKRLRGWWEKSVRRFASIGATGPMQIKVVTVRKSVGRYLSKYLSKGASAVAQFREALGDEAVPRQWWNMSGELRKQTKAAIWRGSSTGVLLDTTINQFFAENGRLFPGRLMHVEVVFDNRPVTVGWFGWFDDETLIDLQRMLESSVNSPTIGN